MGWKNRGWQVTDYELLERYADGERNFAGVELIDSGYRRYGKYSGIDLEVLFCEISTCEELSCMRST